MYTFNITLCLYYQATSTNGPLLVDIQIQIISGIEQTVTNIAIALHPYWFSDILSLPSPA